MKLYFLNGPKANTSQELKPPEVSLGRETDNHIQLLVGGISRYHAKLAVNPEGKWTICDLGSTNGTKVNGVSAETPIVLKDQDVISMGDQQIRVEDASSASGKAVNEKPVFKMPDQSNSVAIFSTVSEGAGSKPVFTPVPDGEKTAKKEPSGKTEDHPQELKKTPDHPQEPKKTPEVPVITPNPTQLGDIFSDVPANGEEAKDVKKTGKSKLGSLLFYVAVIGIAIICVSLFLILDNANAQKKTANVPVVRESPNLFFLSYEKQTIGKSSFFYFTLSVECKKVPVKEANETKMQEVGIVSYCVSEGKAEDRIAYKYSGTKQINAETIKKFRKEVMDTGFMKLKQESADIAPGTVTNDERSSLVIGYQEELNKITVRNASPKNSYIAVLKRIESFAEDVFEIQTLSMSVRQMRAEASKHYNMAIELFDNYEADPANLLNAIKHFKLTVQLLERFTPRPKMCTDAAAQLEKAQKILKKTRTDIQNDLYIKYKLKDYQAAMQKANMLLDYLEPGSEKYEKIRNLKINLERVTAKQKGKR